MKEKVREEKREKGAAYLDHGSMATCNPNISTLVKPSSRREGRVSRTTSKIGAGPVQARSRCAAGSCFRTVDCCCRIEAAESENGIDPDRSIDVDVEGEAFARSKASRKR